MAVLLSSVLVSAVGAALTVTANTETAIASSFRIERELTYAAEAGVERAMQDVRLATQWNDLLTGARTTTFLDRSMTPVLPTGGTLDLRALSARLQAATDARFGGPDSPQWRLVASGRLADIAGNSSIESPAYLVVWVADDVSETDGNPAADSNDVLIIRGEAVGSGGRTRALDVTVTRAGAPAGQPGLRVISWREVR
ncbi:MAG TPA: hypothetical protein VJN96_15420 [Vicinamibacterales bacterium]|nr:hypothetical protein [Vicinamibacterales bacterium]